MNDFIEKPINIKELLEKLRNEEQNGEDAT